MEKAFDPAILQDRRGMGLKNIEARASLLKAIVVWHTQHRAKV